MCLFQFPNKKSPAAYAKGITHFDCGGCPECMSKKSRLWALRCSMEAQVNVGMMVTLTYDTYKYEAEAVKALERAELDKKDKKWLSRFEELPPDPSIPLSKRHCQLFMKRLRKAFPGKTIKYLITAERGKRTHRAHYHALLFGVQFTDLVKYKKSHRGNWIYKSRTLEKIWKHGICTVDCINLSAKTARYCTKYCAKDNGVDDTFMLFSRGIGEQQLLKKFNGLSYWIDGREYSIPKQIWQRYIERKYSIDGYSRYSPKMRLYDFEKKVYNATLRCEKRKEDCEQVVASMIQRYIYTEKTHARGKERNDYYRLLRDGDYLYKRYIAYWERKAAIYDVSRLSVFERIRSLPVSKYRGYRQKALQAFTKQLNNNEFIPPRSKSQGFLKDVHKVKKEYAEKSFAPLSRHYRANDTKKHLYRALVAIRHAVLFKKQPFEPVFDNNARKALGI